jgi:hypothetical protein
MISPGIRLNLCFLISACCLMPVWSVINAAETSDTPSPKKYDAIKPITKPTAKVRVNTSLVVLRKDEGIGEFAHPKGNTTIFYLKYAEARKIAKILNAIMINSFIDFGSPLANSSLLICLMCETENEVEPLFDVTDLPKITANEIINAVIVQGTQRDAATIEKLLQVLDRKPNVEE